MTIHTLHIEHVVMLAIYTLLSITNSLMYKGLKGIHWFSLYNFLALLGAIAVAMRGAIPDFLSIVVGNLFVMAAYMLLFVSLAELLGRRRSIQTYFQLACLLLGAVTMLQYGFIHPDTRLRLIAYSIILALQQAHIAIFVSRRLARGFRMAAMPMTVMLACLAFVNVIRFTGVIYQGAPNDYLQAGAFLACIVLANTCLQCGATVAYFWMTAALLRHDLQVQASTDPLTGLLNRRAIESAAEAALVQCRYADSPISAITIDLDGFKQINDTYGHHRGDAVLTAVAFCLQRGTRESDLLARIGGDEFAILLPRTNLVLAGEIAERLRYAIESLEIPCGDRAAGVSASFGIAQADGTCWEELVTRCDQNLYAVKRAGGNLTSLDLVAEPVAMQIMLA